ncbi:helix-turn-helix transcriptional regulator [Streptomyces anulatus]|uniref:helix-turn-helix transcriptional regulator n=1 Tax=Streptomyces anulatus TaxID=1892 RepID=UPI0036AE0155
MPRTALKMSQERLGELSDTDRQTINRIEQGHHATHRHAVPHRPRPRHPAVPSSSNSSGRALGGRLRVVAGRSLKGATPYRPAGWTTRCGSRTQTSWPRGVTVSPN